MKPINSAAFGSTTRLTLNSSHRNETVRHGRKHACLMLRMVILAAVGLSPQAVGGSITYEFQSYPTAQSGYELSGTITTDGVTGALSASDILSWSYTVSGVGTFNGNGGSVLIIGGVLASATQITIAEPPVPPATETTNELTFIGSDTLSYSQSWDTISVNPLIYFALNIYAFGNESTNFWGTDAPSQSEPWVIATAASTAVPEPSSAVLAMIGAGSIATVGLVRRRRARQLSAHAGHARPNR